MLIDGPHFHVSRWQLIIGQVSEADIGEYQCQIQQSPFTVVNLFVVVHPDVIVIERAPPNGTGLANNYIQIGLMFLAIVVVFPSVIFIHEWRAELIETQLTVKEMKAAILDYIAATPKDVSSRPPSLTNN